MAKKLLVRIPHTTDGKTLKYDENKQVVYRTSIVELTAKKNLQSLNASLPAHLRYEFEEIEVEERSIGSSNEDLKKKLADLEAQNENIELKKRIAELEGKLSSSGTENANTSDDTGNGQSGNPSPAKAEEVIAQVKAATSVEAVKALVEGDARTTVQKAAEKRIAELEGKN